MDEIQLFQLIAEGENERIDFKRMLDLDSAAGKAEFVKDVISLANSAADTGYMLIGVENNGTIVGSGNLEEERIQQIANTYIDPPVMLRCSAIPARNLLTASVIEIKATQRPHKTVRAIERLNQNDVFVRHGSIVVKASPDEIIALNRMSLTFADVQQYVRAAVRHVELNNLDNAIKAYSIAIDLAPSYENFLDRGNVYLKQVKESKPDLQAEQRIATAAAKDFTDAIRLSSTTEKEKLARLGRLHLLNEVRSDFDHTTWQQDLEWLKHNVEGRELGEVLFLEIQRIDNVAGLSDILDKAISVLDQAIHLGYREPQIYYLRADAHHYYAHNHGLALRDINIALALLGELDERFIECLSLKGHILTRMQKFEEAYEALDHARTLAGDRLERKHGGFSHDQDIEEEILYRYGFDYEFVRQHQLSVDLLRPLFQSVDRSHYRWEHCFLSAARWRCRTRKC